MTFAKVRLFVAVAFLLAWVGWLGHQAFSYGRFPVVSHAQLLISTLDVVADVAANDEGRPNPKVTVREVCWPADQTAVVGKDVVVANLPSATGFEGPGRYVVPLVRGEGGDYRVAGLPRSPGFDRQAYFIYPDTPITRRQL